MGHEDAINGKTIRIYLVNGVSSGVLTAEIINWTGKMIVCPRTQLAELAKRDEARRTGAYLLVGPDPAQPSKELVYIGESDNVFKRLVTQHDKDEKKDFWNRTVLIISKDENLTKSHVRYLESRLIYLTKSAGRANLTNDTHPEPNLLPEPDVADMEFFIAQVQMILPVLGLTFTQPKPISSEAGSSFSPVFELAIVGAHATAQQVGDDFIVLKGSTARKQGVDSWTSYRSLREQLVEEGRLVDSLDPQFYVFGEDVVFDSPSGGAAVVAARNMNGRQAWKLKMDGRSYEEWYQDKLKSLGVGTSEAEEVV
jgi:hypothetical protein